jgi:hypothetical protein
VGEFLWIFSVRQDRELLRTLYSQEAMTDTEDYLLDQEAAIETARESSAVPHLQEALKRELNEMLKGRPRDAGVEKRIQEIEEMILRDLRDNASPS